MTTAGAPAETAGGERAVAFTSHLTPRDVFRVAAIVLVRHRLAIMAMAAGPVFWLVGIVGSSVAVTRIGAQFLTVTVGVPVLALVVATWAAYRPGTSTLYAPVAWSFSDTVIDLSTPDRPARAEWSEFRSWRTAAGCYLLDITRSRYLVVPQRDVPDADRADFERMLASKLGPRRR